MLTCRPCVRSRRSIYDTNLAKSLRTIFMRHARLFDGIGGEYQPELAANCRTIRDFDDAITRVSFGWPSVDAYYAGSGSAQVLRAWRARCRWLASAIHEPGRPHAS